MEAENDYWQIVDGDPGLRQCRLHKRMFNVLEGETCLRCTEGKTIPVELEPKVSLLDMAVEYSKPPTFTINRPTQDEYFMKMATVAAERSNCYRRQVGCILVDKQNRVISTGCNGVPRGYPHCEIGSCVRESGKDLHKCLAIHAEMNALIFCSDPDKVWKCYVTHSPCLTCTVMLLQTNCDEIIYGEEYPGSEEAQEIWKSRGRIISCAKPAIPDKV